MEAVQPEDNQPGVTPGRDAGDFLGRDADTHDQLGVDFRGEFAPGELLQLRLMFQVLPALVGLLIQRPESGRRLNDVQKGEMSVFPDGEFRSVAQGLD